MGCFALRWTVRSVLCGVLALLSVAGVVAGVGVSVV